jgi:membrane protein DedA with SNARE-associated domain
MSRDGLAYLCLGRAKRCESGSATVIKGRFGNGRWVSLARRFREGSSGDWISYWFGFKYKEHVAQMWPLSRYPEILPRGEAFVKKWGVPSVFIGRFFGPLRASVPLAAGIFEMPYWRFQIANWISALVWSAALLLFGDVIGQIAEWVWRAV